MSIASTLFGWFGYGGGALGEQRGLVTDGPSGTILGGLPYTSADLALQQGTVWACVDRRAAIIASLPLFTYMVPIVGPKALARGTQLYQLLHDRPNLRMTPFQFWRAMMMNHDLRGNAYARIIRDVDGNATALWPMPADQVEQFIGDDGSVWYLYRLFDQTYILDFEDVLHLQNLGNGTHGLAKLDFMRVTVAEGVAQAEAARTVYANGGKPAALLMTSRVLTPAQRTSLTARFSDIANGSANRLAVLEADMKYVPINMTPEQQQLLQAREATTEELCRWMDVPPVLVYHSNATAWGTGIEAIVNGWYKTTINPLCVNIEQSIRQRVLTPKQRATMSVEFNLDALLRGSAKERFELYASATQNGIMDRDECRQLENLPARGGGAGKLTVQSALLPIDLLGRQQVPGSGNTGTVPTLAQ